MDFDTAALRALTVLAEEQHFGRSAGRLQISQQAMSKRIARLETVTNAALVDRSDRRTVRLTAYGARLAEAARAVLAAVDALPAAPGTGTGRLRIDVLDEHLAPMSWVRRAARSTFPAVDVVARTSDQAPDALLWTGQAQVAFGRAGAVHAPWPARLRRRLVLFEPLSVLVAPSHSWAGLDQIPLADLRGHSWWFPMTDAPWEWRDLVVELSDHAGVTLDTSGSTFGYQQWAADVTAGVAPPSLLGEEMAPPPGLDLLAVPIVNPTPVYPWWLLWLDTTGEDTVADLLTAMRLDAPAPTPTPDVWLPASDSALLPSGSS